MSGVRTQKRTPFLFQRFFYHFFGDGAWPQYFERTIRSHIDYG
jgi:hypothetical protein